jgi:hypothetical protein
MSDIQVDAIDPERLNAMRANGSDEHGNPWTRRTAEGWEPLRCCLRVAGSGEDIALINYSPWTEPSPWAETGPVFVHFGPCGGYPTPHRYPVELADRKTMFNTFGYDGARAYDHITFAGPDDDHEAIVTELLSRPEVAFLHVRSAVAGCFTFAVRPAA